MSEAHKQRKSCGAEYVVESGRQKYCKNCAIVQYKKVSVCDYEKWKREHPNEYLHSTRKANSNQYYKRRNNPV